MKTKILVLAGLAVLALLALTACNNEVDDQVVPNGKLKGYITLSIKAPEVRTSGNGMENDGGTLEENTITNVTIVLTNEAGVITESVKVPIQQGTTNTEPALVTAGSSYVYALVNYEGSTPAGNIKRVIDVTAENEATNGYKNGNFLMVNEFNGGSAQGPPGGILKTISSGNTVDDPLIVPISVDRVAVKIVDENDYSSDAPDIEGLSTKTDALIDGVKITGFVLLNVNKQFNLIQEWESVNPDYVLTTPLAINPNYKGQYFLNIDEYTEVTMNAGKIESISDLTDENDFKEKTVYTTENRPVYTLLGNGELTAGKGETTGVIYRVVAQKEGADIGVFYKLGNMITKDWTEIYKADNSFGEDVPNSEDYPDYRAKGVQIYEEGVMYYTHFIKDVNTNHQLGGKDYYGVFRNSVYRLKINTISNIGDDVPGGATVTPDDPNPPIDSENTYIEVDLTINNWVLNTIGIDF